MHAFWSTNKHQLRLHSAPNESTECQWHLTRARALVHFYFAPRAGGASGRHTIRCRSPFGSVDRRPDVSRRFAVELSDCTAPRWRSHRIPGRNRRNGERLFVVALCARTRSETAAVAVLVQRLASLILLSRAHHNLGPRPQPIPACAGDVRSLRFVLASRFACRPFRGDTTRVRADASTLAYDRILVAHTSAHMSPCVSRALRRAVQSENVCYNYYRSLGRSTFVLALAFAGEHSGGDGDDGDNVRLTQFFTLGTLCSHTHTHTHVRVRAHIELHGVALLLVCVRVTPVGLSLSELEIAIPDSRYRIPEWQVEL